MREVLQVFLVFFGFMTQGGCVKWSSAHSDSVPLWCLNR